MNHWHNYPFVRILIPFILGILFFIQFDFYFSSILIFVLFLACIIITYVRYFRMYKLRFLFGFSFSSLMFVFGFVYTKSNLDFDPIHNPEEVKYVRAIVLEPPDEKEKSIKLILRTKTMAFNDSIVKDEMKLLAYIQKDSLSKALRLGHEILFKAQLKEVAPPQNPHAFNYKRYLSYKRIYYQCYIKPAEWKIIQHNKGNQLKWMADQIRNYLIQKLNAYNFDSAEMGVTSAILLGYDQILDPETRIEFANAGAMHVLCVSGLHVGIIYMVFSFLFSFLKRMKNGLLIKGLIILALLWLYAFITGLSPSVLRASTMFSFIIIGESLKRKSTIYNSLSASAFLLLLMNPLLLMEIGFQLSYSAVIAIVSIYPVLSKRLWVKNRFLQKIRDILIVSLAAQIGTFPLAVYYFHQFPVYFLLTNLFVVSFAGLIIYIGFLFFLLNNIPFLGIFFALLLKTAIQLLNTYVGFIDSLPLSTLNGLVFSLFAVGLIYTLIFSLFRSIILKSKSWFFTALFSIFCLLLLMTYRNYKISSTKQFIVYDAGYGLAMDFISTKKSTLFTDSLMEQKKFDFVARNNWVYSGVRNHAVYNFYESDRLYSDGFMKYKSLIRFSGKNVLVLDGKDRFLPQQHDCDFVILSNNPKVKLREIDSLYCPIQIIINTNNYKSLQAKWKSENSKTPSWFIAEKGAFVQNLD